MPTREAPDESPIGAPRGTYNSHMNVASSEILIGLAGLLFSAFWSATGIAAGQEGYATALVVIAVATVSVGAIRSAYSLIRRTRISIFKNGILVESIWANTFTRWENIEAVLEFDPPGRLDRGLGIGEQYQCGFSRVDGKTFWFHVNRMSRLRDFAAQLHQRADDLIRTRTLRALATGEVVWFGSIGIGRDGVHSRKGVLPWAEVSFAGCVHGTDFDVLKKGSNWGWFSRKIYEVENVAVLTELMRTWKEWASPA